MKNYLMGMHPELGLISSSTSNRFRGLEYLDHSTSKLQTQLCISIINHVHESMIIEHMDGVHVNKFNKGTSKLLSRTMYEHLHQRRNSFPNLDPSPPRVSQSYLVLPENITFLLSTIFIQSQIQLNNKDILLLILYKENPSNLVWISITSRL